MCRRNALNLGMSIVVNPHSQQEELKLLAFLDSMKYDYVKEDDTDTILSPEQINEVLDRDKEYEEGKAQSYSLEEIIAHFKLDDKL
jgi:hypothetical protein